MSGEERSEYGHHATALGLSNSAFVLLRDLIEQKTGMYFDDAKRDLLADKISELVAAHGFSSFLDYYYLLRYDEDAESAWRALMNRLSVPETYFWRQYDQVEVFAETIAREHFEKVPNLPLRVWSAACCTGEEPISLAIALAEAGLLDRYPIEILASDGSPAMVEKARRGIYGERSFRALPLPLRERYFEKVEKGWRISSGIHGRINWSVVNLLDAEQVSAHARVHVIFCRNVFIYFSDDAIRNVTTTMAGSILDPGYLFLGASESLTRLSAEFSLQQRGSAFLYEKIAGANSDGRAGSLSGRTQQNLGGTAGKKSCLA